MLNSLYKIWKPEVYHGHNRNDNFFEGWFFKIVDSKKKNTIAIIPGIFKSRDRSKQHAFIQILDAATHQSHYIKFTTDDFTAELNQFKVNIGDNYFSSDGIKLKINSTDISIHGELKFKKSTPWESNFFNPGIMGWYSFVPFMECNHGIISLDHYITGSIKYNSHEIDFTGGRGYTEKDWGSSFPSSYVWMQSNHFSKPGISFTASIAKIPWLLSSFRGFIIGLYFENRLYKFATYTGAELEQLKITESEVSFCINDKNYRIEASASRAQSGTLHAPYENMMTERVAESLSSEINVKLVDKKNNEIIFEDTGTCAGLDVNGKLEEIVY